MSCLHVPIPKQLKQLPSTSKKAWKSFTASIHPKLHRLRNHLEIPTSVTAASARRLLHLRPKRRPRSMGRHPYYQYLHLQQQCSSVPVSPATVHVDRLFEESSKTQSTGPAPTSAAERNNSGGRNEDHRSQYAVKTEQRTRRSRVKVGSMESQNVRWTEYVSSLPTIRGVDERAEEFISKFRQEMQLQREESILEFQQMLARSTA